MADDRWKVDDDGFVTYSTDDPSYLSDWIHYSTGGAPPTCEPGQFLVWNASSQVYECSLVASGTISNTYYEWNKGETMDLAPIVIALAVIGLATCIGSVITVVGMFEKLFDRTKALRKRIKRLERRVNQETDHKETE